MAFTVLASIPLGRPGAQAHVSCLSQYRRDAPHRGVETVVTFGDIRKATSNPLFRLSITDGCFLGHIGTATAVHLMRLWLPAAMLCPLLPARAKAEERCGLIAR